LAIEEIKQPSKELLEVIAVGSSFAMAEVSAVASKPAVSVAAVLGSISFVAEGITGPFQGPGGASASSSS